MRKGWHIISGIALMCVLLGAVGIAVGLFTGSSPAALENHGSLGHYLERLAINWEVIRGWLGQLAGSVRQLLPL